MVTKILQVGVDGADDKVMKISEYPTLTENFYYSDNYRSYVVM